MDERHRTLPTLTPFTYAGFAFLALLTIGLPTLMMAVLGIFAGGWIIVAVVRSINRRDDPLSAKRPPDPP